MQHEVIEAAHAWLAEDPDPRTREELRGLLGQAEAAATEPGGGANSAAAAEELAERFAGTLRFGTAGMRGRLGAGPMRMNRSVVIRTAAGLVRYLQRTLGSAAGSAPAAGLVVIGYDARHLSAEFARDTAAVVTGAGLRAALLPRPLPTPVLTFAVGYLGAVAGVMVTASHNPPGDNGYKVYLGGGYQIVPPVDAEIAAEIDAVGPLAEVPRPDSGWQLLDDTVHEAYLARSGSVLTEGSARDLRVVHTALHGVGTDTFRTAFVRAGFPEPVPVPEQAAPDPEFPTLAFPNPEEAGALDHAFAAARTHHPDLVIANDPDADRCAVAVPDPAAEAGWRMLHGDEVGALLAAHLVHKQARGTFATTIVSSSLLSRIAGAAKLPYAETLTGFKWLCRVPELRYAYEEALGYCTDPQAVPDKDGITAALLVAELAAELKLAGRELTDLLDDLAVEHGLHCSGQLSLRVEDLTLIDAAMDRLRAQPPQQLGRLPVAEAEDLSKGVGGLPPTDGLRYRLEGEGGTPAVRGARVIVRPSGTEAKLKCYLEAAVDVAGATQLDAARAAGNAVIEQLKEALGAATGL